MDRRSDLRSRRWRALIQTMIPTDDAIKNIAIHPTAIATTAVTCNIPSMPVVERRTATCKQTLKKRNPLPLKISKLRQSLQPSLVVVDSDTRCADSSLPGRFRMPVSNSRHQGLRKIGTSKRLKTSERPLAEVFAHTISRGFGLLWNSNQLLTGMWSHHHRPAREECCTNWSLSSIGDDHHAACRIVTRRHCALVEHAKTASRVDRWDIL